MDLEQLDLGIICRTCKASTEDMCSLFETPENQESPHLDEMLMACTSIQINSEDGLPSKLCQICVTQLKNAFTFKKQCEETDSNLRSYLKNMKSHDIKEEIYNSEYLVPPDSEGAALTYPNTDDYIQIQENNITIFTCRLCLEDFKTLDGLRFHKTQICTDEPAANQDQNPKYDFLSLQDNNQIILSCKICLKTCITLDGFRSHKRTHMGGMFKCKQCDREYTRLNSLQRHELSHNNQKVHVCRICSKTLTRTDHLKRHLITHLKEKPFTCSNCNRGFSRHEHLTNHIPKCRGEKVHVCNICNKVFFREDSLELHMKLHENHEPVLPTIDTVDNIEEHYYEIDYHEDMNFSDSDGGEEDDFKMKMPVETSLVEEPTEIPLANSENEEAMSSDSDYEPQKMKKRGRGRPRKNPFSIAAKLTKTRGRGRPPAIKVEDEKTNELSCMKCDKTFTSAGQLNKHNRTEHDRVKIYKCKVCEKEFGRANHLKRHSLSHSENKPYDCEVCSKSFARRDHLTQHRRSHQKQSFITYQYECSWCDKSFAEMKSLHRHCDSKHGDGEKLPGEKKHECPVCKKMFTTEKYRDVHLKGHSGEKHFQCKTCNKFYLSKSHLNEHMKFHNDHSKKFLCSECGQRFIRNDYLVIHMRRHRGEKPFKCKFCGKGFPRTTDLTVHERYHTGEKTHLCTICGRGFSRAYNLTVHMRTHTGEKPYQCTYCEAAFAQGNDLKAHIRRHTGERFHCELCSESFLMGYLLTQHKRNIHGLNVVSNIRRLQPVNKKEENPDQSPPIEIPLPKPVVPEIVFNTLHQTQFSIEPFQISRQ